MSKIENYYAASNYYDTIQKKQKRETEKAESKKTKEASQTKLSKKAQDLLEKLRKTYGNMDFMVADFENGEDAQKILSRGTKEFSVLFSSEELEKMASDEKYEKEYMDRIKGAVRMSEQINQEYGFASAFGENSENGELARVGVSFHKDGTVTYFAEMEKASDKQKTIMEEGREKRAEEKKADEKELHSGKDHVAKKKVTIQASSLDELLKKIAEIDWSQIKEEEQIEGSRFDLSI